MLFRSQLREGVLNFFVTFIEVLADRAGDSIEVEPKTTSGDFLTGFFLGTRAALHEKGRESVTITVKEVSPFTVGVLIALFERAVGFYATLVNINAYHQPGVEAGKKAAGAVIALKLRLMEALRAAPGESFTVEELAIRAGAPDKAEATFKILERLAANRSSGVRKRARARAVDSTFRLA